MGSLPVGTSLLIRNAVHRQIQFSALFQFIMRQIVACEFLSIQQSFPYVWTVCRIICC